MRDCISNEERVVYTTKSPNIEGTKRKINKRIHFEIMINFMRHKKEGKLAKFQQLITHENVLCRQKDEANYEIRRVFEEEPVFDQYQIPS